MYLLPDYDLVEGFASWSSFLCLEKALVLAVLNSDLRVGIRHLLAQQHSEKALLERAQAMMTCKRHCRLTQTNWRRDYTVWKPRRRRGQALAKQDPVAVQLACAIATTDRLWLRIFRHSLDDNGHW